MDTHASSQPIIGILGLQGDFAAHRKLLEERLNARTVEVRTVADLAAADALILPGGESTTIYMLMERIGLDQAIRRRAEAGMPIYGTCAGLILLATEIEGQPNQPKLGLMDVRVARNAFGRQRDSFEADIPFAANAGTDLPVRGVFIRAPYVTEVRENVQVLSRFQEKIVGVRQNALLGTAFHPELTDDDRIHRYFLDMVAESAEKRE